MPCQCKTDRQRAKCQFWIGPEAGILETNETTGEQRLTTGCFPEVLVRLFRFVVQTNSHAAAAIESHRNLVADGFARLVDRVPHLELPHAPREE